jgi:glucosamine-6-phosphate deaminase
MRVYKAKDYEQLSRMAANIIAAQVVTKPESVLGLATGSSAEGIYKFLSEKYLEGDVNFSKAKSVNLDEYVGLSPDDPNSYNYFMRSKLFDNINLGEYFLPNGSATDLEKECERYENLLNSMEIDIQLLGIGVNGHIGFNEPGEVFSKGVWVVDLEESTRAANSRFFKSMDDVPKKAFTLGVAQIMKAKKILLIANGESKAEALYKAIKGDISPSLPASILQLHHEVIIIGDEMALKKI